MRGKYFGLGLSRTGTTSLSNAFRRLGFTHIAHLLPPPAWDRIADYDFANDLPICTRYPELDERFPGSRFVYNWREVESWLISCEKLEQRLLKQAPYYDWMKAYHSETYGAEYFDENLWRAAHARHDEQVREFFQSRPDDLLIMNITEGDGYETLIPWIGWENIRFPWANATHRMNERAAI